MPVVSPEVLNWLNTKQLYNSYWAWIDYAKDSKEQKTRIDRFIIRLNNDLDLNFQNRFKIQSQKFEMETQTLTVKVLGISEADLETFKSYTSKSWSQFGLNVNLEWTSALVKDSFELIMEMVGGRAFVDVDSSLHMHLPNIVWSSIITHEFGHILGLHDQYYTVWNEEKCLYSDESNAENIMSDQSTGVILPEHIHAILEHYNQKSTGL